GLLDHRETDAVLDGAARIEVLELGQDARLHIASDPVEPDDRRIADKLQDGGIVASHRPAKLSPPFLYPLPGSSADPGHPILRRKEDQCVLVGWSRQERLHSPSSQREESQPRSRPGFSTVERPTRSVDTNGRSWLPVSLARRGVGSSASSPRRQ